MYKKLVLTMLILIFSVGPMAISRSPAGTFDKAVTKLENKCYCPVADRADVLIITNESIADAWRPFADWKTMTGRPAKVVTTQFIEENFVGDDIQQKIRQCCLKHIKEQQTKWVVLGGDSSGDGGLVPDRDTDHSECRMLSYDNIPTDLYYISETDWDANDDGKYGVFSDDLDAVSYYNPSATIGRIPVRTTDDVFAYTDKVVEYESSYPVGDFARRMIYTCPEKNAYPKLESSIKEVSGAWAQGTVHRFFGNETPWDDQKRGDHDLTPDNWIEMINSRQASKIHMHGHGLLNLWVLENNQTVRNDSVAKLTNERAYPIITTVSCLTGQYDEKNDPCITESMLRQPNAGAIAILAPSREGVPFMMSQSDFRLMMTDGKMDGTTGSYAAFWKYALSEGLTLGEAFRKVKMKMESNARKNDGFHMLQCELNLLGDPTLVACSSPPKNFGRVRIRQSGKTLKIRRIANAKVCLWNGKEDYQIIDADSDGNIEKELTSDAKEYRIAIMANGYNIWHKGFEPAESEKAVNTKPSALTSGDQEKPDGRTLQEFKSYVSGKLSEIDEETLNRIAKVVDRNGDNIISNVEFEQRMEAIQSVFNQPSSSDDGSSDDF